MTKQIVGGEPFFRYFAWVILLTVIACFGAKAIFDSEDLPPITTLHHVHAVSMLSWFVLFAVQPTLIHLGKVRVHRLLGALSPLIVLAFFSFAISISLLNWGRMGAVLIVTANGINLAIFLGLYLAAITLRRHAAAHKRLMLYASLSMMGPAFGRIPEIFDQSPFLAVPFVFAYQLAPPVHDFVKYRRVHPATWIGFGLLLAAIPAIVGLSGSESWAAVLESVLGPRGGTAH